MQQPGPFLVTLPNHVQLFIDVSAPPCHVDALHIQYGVTPNFDFLLKKCARHYFHHMLYVFFSVESSVMIFENLHCIDNA